MDIQNEKLNQRIKKLQKRNNELERFYDEYRTVCRNEEERVKELNSLYHVAQCVVTENDMDKALNSIVRNIPSGWQYTSDSCARILLDKKKYHSDCFFESTLFQVEEIFLDNQIVGSVEVFYKNELADEAKSPFLKEERNLLKGIADIISFYIKKKRDDENRKIIQQQLLHADRLSTIGQLAAGVAHELNEPLGNILGLAQLSLKIPKIPDQAKQDLLKIEDCAMYSREIIKKLMEFSRQTALSKEQVDFSLMVDNSLSFLEARCIKEGVVLIKQLKKNILITVDPNQIKQVITNLTINAIQAMKNGGTLTINTRTDGKNAILSIEDTGSGMSGDNISKAFMPFYTTKDVGEGTGLGLSVVYGIIQNHAGDIKVSSQLGQGTQFEVLLPLETT